MLNPRSIINAFVTAVSSISAVSSAMTPSGGSSPRITAFHYMAGSDHSLREALVKMSAPSMLVVWEATGSAGGGGAYLWKHRLGVYIKMANSANSLTPVGYEDIWWSICNGLPTGSAVNLRYMQLLPSLDIMDTPTIVHVTDEDQIDRFKATFIFPEIGDN